MEKYRFSSSTLHHDLPPNRFWNSTYIDIVEVDYEENHYLVRLMNSRNDRVLSHVLIPKQEIEDKISTLEELFQILSNMEHKIQSIEKIEQCVYKRVGDYEKEVQDIISMFQKYEKDKIKKDNDEKDKEDDDDEDDEVVFHLDKKDIYL